MTVFGVLWLGLIVWCVYSEKLPYLLALTLFSMVFQCSNVIAIGGLNVGPQVITNLAFLLVALLKALKQGSVALSGAGRAALPAAALVLAALASALLNGSLPGTLLRLLQLAVYGAAFGVMAQAHRFVSEAFVARTVKRLTLFVLVMGAVQLLITSGLLPRLALVKLLFYNENASYVYYNRAHYTRLMSTFLEPSYCGGFLVGAFFYFASMWKGTKREAALLAALAAEILLTRSSTAYGAFAVTGALFLLRGRNREAKKLLLLAGGLGLGWMLVLGRGVLDEVVFSKLLSASAATRHRWNTAAWQAFLRSPVYGVGYKNARASSLLVSVLGEMGLVGLAAWAALNGAVLRPLWEKRRLHGRQFYAVRFALLGVLAAQLLACPDLDFCVYWLWMDLAALCGLAGRGPVFRFEGRERRAAVPEAF